MPSIEIELSTSFARNIPSSLSMCSKYLILGRKSSTPAPRSVLDPFARVYQKMVSLLDFAASNEPLLNTIVSNRGGLNASWETSNAQHECALIFIHERHDLLFKVDSER